MKFLDFDPHKRFIDLIAFRITFFGGLIAAAGVAITIWQASNLTCQWDYEGFNNALTIFKVPLGIMAVTIPIIALLAANHRSEQSREQMRLSEEQNRFSNHYKHVEEFEKYCLSHEHKSGYLIKRKRYLHSTLFPNSRIGRHKLSEPIKEEINRAVLEFSNSFSPFKKVAKENILKINDQEANKIAAFYVRIRRLIDDYQIEIDPRSEDQPGMEKTGISIEQHMIEVGIQGIKTIRFISELLEFDETYTPSLATIEVCAAGPIGDESKVRYISYLLGRIDEAANTEAIKY